jgi:DHA1 family inner membrane transport protein
MAGETSGTAQTQRQLKLLSSIAVAIFATEKLDILMSLFLLEVALTFQITVGAASQLATISKVAAILIGLLISALSVRFKHKSLLLAGSLAIVIGSLGCVLAPDFLFMQIFYPLDGAGTVMVKAMALALIGQFLPINRRAKAVGLTVAASSLALVIGSPLAGFAANFGGWRSSVALFMLPLSIAGLVFAFFGIPSKPNQKPAVNNSSYLGSFKQIFLNRSASACLVGMTLFSALQAWGLFGITFYRSNFSVSLDSATIILLVVTLFLAVGGATGGRIVNKLGRKRTLVSTTILRSILVAVLVFAPNLWIALLIDLVFIWLGGIGFTASGSIGLEQVPNSRGTMMSLVTVVGALGGALGVFVGGMVLDSFGFLVMAPVLAAFGVASALVFQFFTKESIS